MNVLNIPKQSDRPLIYTGHAHIRAFDKDIPKPKYIPLNAQLVDKQWDKENECISYKIKYKFNEREYVIVVSDDWRVITMYGDNGHWHGQTKTYKRYCKMVDKLRKYPTPYKRKSKYKHLDYTESGEEFNYA